MIVAASYAMNGIHFIIDENGRKRAMTIDLKKPSANVRNFLDGLMVEGCRKKKDIPLEDVIKARAKRRRLHD